ncbi:hypothetical protein [Ligilactobacillus equi]|uniref:UvrA n=2 Tax=Ligilactobacillus equi TaxID=137357 RepID=V7HV73_9LACO|nr:hypothetical protein [Ligilactobacillus equi]ETA73792.1 UvrA [Ligilactobacillus equi DPC 6820]KRL84417.1 hypothetical protein FC36_GL000173 [Ligilactobacillus equi DSM 15833 = JCM 10991]
MKKERILELLQKWCQGTGVTVLNYEVFDPYIFCCELQTSKTIVTIEFEFNEYETDEEVGEYIKEQIADVIGNIQDVRQLLALDEKIAREV